MCTVDLNIITGKNEKWIVICKSCSFYFFPLQPETRSTMHIREDGSGQTLIENLQEVPIYKKDDIYALLKLGEYYRRYGETNMNERSSRSHTIFRYEINYCFEFVFLK